MMRLLRLLESGFFAAFLVLVLVGCSVTSPGGGGGTGSTSSLPPVGPLVVSGGKSLSWEVYHGDVQVFGGSSRQPFSLSRAEGSSVYAGEVPGSGSEVGQVLGLRISGNRIVGATMRSRAWDPGEGAEFESTWVSTSHSVGSYCTGAGLNLGMNGWYGAGGAAESYFASVSLVICDPAMAAAFQDGMVTG